jgi:subtilisin family serine protease
LTFSKKLKNLLFFNALILISACGGGGGGGITNKISDFINDDISSLSGSADIITNSNNLIRNFNAVVSNGDFSGLSAVLTGPNEEDRNTAITLLAQLDQAVTLWEKTETLISQQEDATKYQIYNSDSYKEAYAALVYLKDHVKPVITKVSQGRTITLTEYNKVAKQEKADEIISTEKNNTASTYSQTKLIKTEGWVKTKDDESKDTYSVGESTTKYTGDWETVNAGGGQLRRPYTKTIPNYKTTTITRCTAYRTTLLNGTYTDTNTGCSVASETTVAVVPTIENGYVYKDGPNPVVSQTTINTEPVVTEQTRDINSVVTVIDSDVLDRTPIEGAQTTNSQPQTTTSEVINGDGTTTKTTTTFTRTYTYTAMTTPRYFVRSTITQLRQEKRSVSTITPSIVYTYQDGTTETIEQSPTVNYGTWTAENKGDATTVTEEIDSDSYTWTKTTYVDSESTSTAQTYPNNNNTNLGTTTPGYLTKAGDYEDNEYQISNGLGTIKASSAYAKGWTGKGAVLGVIDTWQQIDHPDLDGQYEWYNDYTRYDTTVANGGDQQVHGTHVAGIIAAKNNGSGTQGVAFDSKLVGANVDYHGKGGVSKNNAQLALHDMAELKAPVSEGGQNMNIVAVNMSINNEVSYLTDRGDYNVTQLADGTYHAPKVIEKITANGMGEARYWRHATDSDIVLVNSAGNSQYVGNFVPADPGLWATETDSNGDLVLGGKMIIVGNWNGTGVSGNKAGHVCLSINTSTNTCNDTYRISDFYILAPGMNVNSTVPIELDGDGYMTMTGTSMAAPHVTGAIGIINQMWPHMKGENLTKLLLNTADKNLLNYDVNVHGQGLLDLDEATKPQGAVGIPLTGRTNGPVILTNNMSFASGAYVPSELKNLQVMLLDSYERDYYVNVGESFTVQDKRKYSDVDGAMKGYTYLPFQQSYGNFAQGGQYDLGYINFGLYTGENGNGDWTTNIGKDFKIDDKLTLKATVGTMNEANTWLGNLSSGALAVGQDNKTNFAQIGVSYELGKGAINFDYGISKTDVNTVTDSLIKSVDNVQSKSMKIGLDVKDNNKKWGASISLPSKITSGNMHLSVPETRTIDGQVIHTDINSNLAGGKQEVNYGIYYGKDKLGEINSGFNFKAEYRHNIAGVDGINGINIGFNYIKKLNTNCKFLWKKNPKCYKKNFDGKLVLNKIK